MVDYILSFDNIDVVEQPVVALESVASQIQAVRFVDGALLSNDASFIRPMTTHRTTSAYDLGCKVSSLAGSRPKGEFVTL